MWLITLIIFSLVCTPLAGLILRRKIYIELVPSADKEHVNLSKAQTDTNDVEILLIHGTFARNAKWTRNDAPFVIGLRERFPRASIYKILWSGDNSFGQRIKAAKHAAQWLKDRKAKRIIIIGHSFGGYIGALAASICNDRRIKLVTMSTPFVNISARSFGSSLLWTEHESLGLLLLLVAYPLLFLVLALLALSLSHLEYGGYIFVPVSIISIVALWRSDKRLKIGIKNNLAWLQSRADAIAELTRVNLSSDQMYIVRTPGDEASGILAISHMASWIVFNLQRAISLFHLSFHKLLDGLLASRPINLLLFKTYLILFIFIAIFFPAHLMQHGHPSYIVWPIAVLMGLIPVMIVLFLLEAVSWIMLTIVSAIVSLPFGLDLALRAMYISVSVDATPIGKWNTILTVNHKMGLSHSALYAQNEIFDVLQNV
jgi:pimeloyl-ACP methyl ester carboxylesterase